MTPVPYKTDSGNLRVVGRLRQRYILDGADACRDPSTFNRATPLLKLERIQGSRFRSQESVSLRRLLGWRWRDAF